MGNTRVPCSAHPRRPLTDGAHPAPTAFFRETRRHFRDTTWAALVPRRLRELTGDITRACDELSARLGRNLFAGELADRLYLPKDEIAEDPVGARSGPDAHGAKLRGRAASVRPGPGGGYRRPFQNGRPPK